MDEFALIDRYFRRPGGEGVRLGIGDDAAVLAPPPGRLLVIAVDTLVEGVHYLPSMPAADIGYRALAVNLSDLAAMGATPAWMTLALTLPEAVPDWLEDFAAGLFELADSQEVALVGGDTTKGAQTVISLQLAGHIEEGSVIRRDGCQPGNQLFVSGTPGDAAAGLEELKAGRTTGRLVERFRRPRPRVELGRAVAGIASAGIDLSDGLYADLERLLAASGVAGVVEREALPVSDALRASVGEDAWQAVLAGGDDYELCLAVPAPREQVFRDAAAQVGVPVTRIGQVEAGSGLRVTDAGADVDYRHAGYRHF